MTEGDKALPIVNGRKACSDSIEELANDGGSKIGGQG
jgi:hypothetical protein